MENEFKSASYQEVGKGWSLKGIPITVAIGLHPAALLLCALLTCWCFPCRC